ncbi:MAG: hypothetical protein JW729_11060 [Bacteroidales bacterium]|nr:hypothetical protein [Bacteroidales bacterium]
MKRFYTLAIIAVFFMACGNNAEQAQTKQEDSLSATETPVLTLEEFNTEAGNFVDKEIILEGIVDHVCKHGGKRLFLVSDDGDVHVDGEERFDDALVGSDITVIGIVKEFRVDEAYCLQQEEGHIQKHKEGVDSDDVHQSKMNQIKMYRDSMQSAGVDHLSFYSVQYISHKTK